MTPEVQKIHIDSISTPVSTRPVDQAHVARLAESIKSRGLDVPVVVHTARADQGGRFVLGYGRHRLEAFKLLGEAQIPAIVKGSATDDELVAEQVAENLQRKDLTPLEEADLCAGAMDRAHGDEEAAAAIMGRPERWVLNRAALSRLSPKVKAWIAEGVLPIGHAQLIARVPSVKTQDDLADRARSGKSSYGYNRERPVALSELTDWVEKEGRNLADVNWRLDAVFGKHGACAACPHNSANRGDLFAEGAEPKKPTCLERVCFTEKVALASRGAQKAANWLVKEGLKVTPATAAQAVAAREVPFVKPSVVKGYIRTKAKPAKGGKSAEPEKPKDPTPKELLTDATDEWLSDVNDLVEEATKGKPLVQAFLGLVSDTRAFAPSWGGKGDHKKQQAIRPLMAKAGKLSGDDLLAVARLVDARNPIGRLPNLPDDLTLVIADALGVKLPPRPTLEGIKAELAKKAEADKKAAAKKPAPKKKAA
jgi:ParB/RepB/Spo0J family partition protein